MNFGTLFKIFDAVNAVMTTRDTDTRATSETPDTDSKQAAATAFAGPIEARLANVVVAALKEAFDRDHARLELERAHLEEQRKRAEETMRMETRRRAADLEVSRLRLLAGTAILGWIVSVALLVPRLDDASVPSRVVLVIGWLLLLCSLGTGFNAQNRISAAMTGSNRMPDRDPLAAAALWLLIAGLALSAVSLLF